MLRVTGIKPTSAVKIHFNAELKSDFNIGHLRGVCYVLNLQGFMTDSTFKRYKKIIDKAICCELKLRDRKTR
jgi:hypothetical protein